MLYAIVAVLVIIVDQWVKYWVAGAIAMESTGETFIPGLISLVNLHNDGAAFSFLSGGGARIYFIILTGVFTVAVILALATNFISGRVARWSIVLVTAGGLSNCIDRVISGYVQDMFKIELFNFPIFNVADIFITVFCLVFVFAIIFEKDRPDDYYDDEFDDEDDEEEDRPPRRKLREQKKSAPDAAVSESAPEKKSRKARKAKYEDEYEQYKAARAARQKQSPAPAAPAQGTKPVFNPADPFAEWEKANAKVESQQRSSPAARAAGITPSGQYTAPRRPAQATQGTPARPAATTVRPSAPAPAPAAPMPVQQPAPARPAPFAAPAPQAPSPAPAPAKGQDADFSLDDILAEFK